MFLSWGAKWLALVLAEPCNGWPLSFKVNGNWAAKGHSKVAQGHTGLWSGNQSAFFIDSNEGWFNIGKANVIIYKSQILSSVYDNQLSHFDVILSGIFSVLIMILQYYDLLFCLRLQLKEERNRMNLIPNSAVSPNTTGTLSSSGGSNLGKELPMDHKDPLHDLPTPGKREEHHPHQEERRDREKEKFREDRRESSSSTKSESDAIRDLKASLK